jgi:undecaprenyl-diphosphatase
MLACAGMNLVQAIVLGVVQGLTEFLPVSSSAHLFIVPKLLGWQYAGLGFDVALHWGTLLALLVAFGSTWIGLIRDVFARDPLVRREAMTTWFKLLIASLPAAIAGVLLRHAAETWLRWLPLQAVTLTVFGFLLWWVDRVRPQSDSRTIPGWGTGMVVGLAQVLSLVPGVSRSGVTITAGRAMGESRVAAARFSFLLATPITLGAGLLELKHIEPGLSTSVVLAGVVSAAVVGWLAIRALLKMLQRVGFGTFFAYRVLVAGAILAHVLMQGNGSARPFAARHLVGEVAVQSVTQRDARAMQPRLHGGHRELEHLGHLGVR